MEANPLFKISTNSNKVECLNELAVEVKKEFMYLCGKKKFFANILRLSPNTIEHIFIENKEIKIILELMDYPEVYFLETLEELDLIK
jgi:hypothetical protein